MPAPAPLPEAEAAPAPETRAAPEPEPEQEPELASPRHDPPVATATDAATVPVDGARDPAAPQPEPSASSRLTRMLVMGGAGIVIAGAGAAYYLLADDAGSTPVAAVPSTPQPPESVPEPQQAPTPLPAAPAVVPTPLSPAPVALEPAVQPAAPPPRVEQPPTPAAQTPAPVRAVAAPPKPRAERTPPPAPAPADDGMRALLSRAEQYLAQAQFDKAIATAESILALHPDNRAARVLLDKAKTGQLEALRAGSSIE